MKRFVIKSIKFFIVGLILLKFGFMSDYLAKDSFTNFTMEFATGEEGSPEKDSLEDGDEIFHNTSFEWQAAFNLPVSSEKSSRLIRNLQNHIREIIPPPPQG